jgi:uncharacterized linocin/CFP29 family protein
MDILKRELAPIVPKAWEEIDRQAKRVLTLKLTARKLVDFDGPHGWHHAALNLGRLVDIAEPPAIGVRAALRTVQPLVELRVPFRLSLDDLDGLARGASDVELAPVIEAAERIAEAEDHTVFNGYREASILGMIEASPHPPMTMPSAAEHYPEAVLGALEVLRQAGINGPYALALGSDCFKQLALATDGGYPMRKRLEQQILERPVLWAPAAPGAVLLSVRGGDFLLTVGADLSIGYAGHDRGNVDLYLVESFTFRVLEGAAAVHLRLPKADRGSGSGASRST